jgi:hypothetical protein
MLCGADRQYPIVSVALLRCYSVTITGSIVHEDRKYNRLWGTIIWHGKFMVLIYKIG